MRARPAPRDAAAGFSLPELLTVMAIVALMATLAYPSFRGTLQRIRRADALAALQQLQAAQERFRAEHPRYASLDELRLGALSPQGHYALVVQSPSATGYEAHAAARGVQAADTACRHLRLVVAGADTLQHSGPAPDIDNLDAANRRCWGE